MLVFAATLSFFNCFCIIYSEGVMIKVVLHFTALKVCVQRYHHLCVSDPSQGVILHRNIPHNSASLDISLVYCVVQNSMW